MSLFGKCGECDRDPDWRIDRRGDAAVDWACAAHLSTVCTDLQRDHEVTELVVRDHHKASEWATIGRTLDAIATSETSG